LVLRRVVIARRQIDEAESREAPEQRIVSGIA
jgi:hypothetical protein